MRFPANQLNVNPAVTPPTLAAVEPLEVPPTQLVEGTVVVVMAGKTCALMISTVTGAEVQLSRLLVMVEV